MDARLLEIINKIRLNKGLEKLPCAADAMLLRKDFGLDSFDLAELTVNIEVSFGSDVFADGLVETFGELKAKLKISEK